MALAFLSVLPGEAASAAAASFKPSRIAVAVRGSGPDVILIHGMGASRTIWNGTVLGVPGYRYHLVQILGFAGTSPGGNARGKVAAPVAEEIARYIAANRLQKPALVGHSMGGSIAMMVAARHPQLVGKAMVVDMVPAASRLAGFPGSAPAPIASLLGREIEGADRFRRDLKSLVGRFGSADWLETGSDGGVIARSVEELVATDLTPELVRIRAPLTVVYACPEPLRLSRPAIDRFYARAYAARPGTKLVRIERSGHTIMADQPAAFRAALKAFLRGG